MQLVVFAVIAILAVIFLIMFNLKSARGGRKPQTNTLKPAEENIALEQNTSRTSESTEQFVKINEPNQADSDYRQALRVFANVSEVDGEAVSNMPGKSPDQAYREGLRAMQKDGKDKTEQ